MKLITLIALATLIASCSSTPKIPKNTQAVLQTRITFSGLKHFQMQFVPNEQQIVEIPLHRRSNSTSAPPISADRKVKQTEERLIAHAKLAIDEIGYCKKGFWVLDRNLFASAPYIRGECNDTATEKDRTDFPDTITKW